MQLKQRTILITGGTSGIGLELARQLLARNNTVIVTGRDADRLALAQREMPALHGILSDVSNADAIGALHATVLDRFPSLDVLINNAGVMRNLDLTQTHALADVTREIDINLRGPVHMVQQFLPQLQARKQGAIINITSGLAFVPLAIAPVYSATKAALHAYTRALRVQLAGRVEVFEIAPPGVETPLLRAEFQAEMQGQKGMAVDALVRQAIAGIEAGRVEIRPGLANVLKAMSRIAPEFMFRQMTKMMKPKPAPAV
ncbi:MAG: short-chain dehydrogenase [Rhodoferax sp.]|nr:short-chain dehydrogenase [Rhodoferax sp.]